MSSWIYDKIKESHDLRFYYSIVLTLGQNRLAAINALKFISNRGISEKSGLTSRINVDGVDYNVLINKHIYFKAPMVGVDYEYRAKVNIDASGNVSNIVLSTYKRKLSGFIDDDRITAFDRFVESFSTGGNTILTPGTRSSVNSMASTSINNQLQNMAVATSSASMPSDFV